MGQNKPQEQRAYVSVSEFYRNRSIFMTGGTGFMGKVLVYKLLKSCPDIKCIYLLMRPKRGEHVNARLCKLIGGVLFSRLRDFDPLVLNKIVPIHGDISQPRLGISDLDLQILKENVSIVFHLAATVKFDETLKDSVSINVLGTQRLIELCHDMVNLEALIHVSTAYSNCDRHEVTEVVYPPPFSPEQIMQCVEWMDDSLLNALTSKLLGKHPNTYTFTKALAEHVILTLRRKLPVSIVRPSLVLSSLYDPEPGWVDNWNGPNKIMAVCGRGNFRSVLVHKEKHIDLIPVDIVVNLMISAAWRTALCRPDDVTVYNCCSGLLNPITWESFITYSFEAMHKYPTTHLVLKPKLALYRHRSVSYLSDLFLHIIPAVLCDAVSYIFGHSTYRYLMHRKLCRELRKLEYFALHEWQFLDYNVRLLSRLLSEEDRNEFTFDVTQINWQNYVDAYILGIRKYILKESAKTIPEARIRQRRLVWFERILKLFTAVLVFSASLLIWLRRAPHYRYFIINLILYSLRVIRML